MANRTIDDFSAVAASATTDTLIVTQSAVAKKETLAQIDTLLSATAKTLTNKTLTSPVINTGVSGTAIDTDGTLAANSDTLLASQKAIKTFVAGKRVNKTQATSPYTVTAADCNGLTTLTNTGASDETIFNLPAGADGYRVRAVVTAAQYLTLDANGTETIRYLATQSAAGGYVRSNVIGNIIELEWSGTEWVVVGRGGPWTYDS